MCPLCGALLAEHWSDPEDGGARRGRVMRTRIVRRVLAGFGVTLSDWGGTAYVLHDGKGAPRSSTTSRRCGREAERLAGRPLDPLDPALVAALRRDA